MKRFVVTALGAAAIALLGASSAAQAAMIDFTVIAIGGTPTYTGTSLDQSTAVDLDIAILLVSEVGPSDDSGLTPGADTIDLSPRDIVFGTGPGTPLGFSVTKAWTGDNNDTFTETLTTVDSIDRSTLDQIIVHLSGTVSDSLGPLRGYAGLSRFERHPIWRSGTTRGDIHQYGDHRRHSRALDLGYDGAWVRRSRLRRVPPAQRQYRCTFSRKSQSLVEHLRKAALFGGVSLSADGALSAFARLAVSERLPLRCFSNAVQERNGVPISWPSERGRTHL